MLVRPMRTWCAVIAFAVAATGGAALAYQAPMVFFDFGSDRVSPTGRVHPQRVAHNWAKVPSACEPKALIVGHLDGAEAEGSHNDLDGRRATAVAIALREEGWTHVHVEIVRRGFTKPLVQTSRGVREPQNRRVEIVPVSATKAGVLRCWTSPVPYGGGCERSLEDGTVCPSPESTK